MKKITSLLLCLVMLLCAATALSENAAGASPAYSETVVIEDLGETDAVSEAVGIGDGINAALSVDDVDADVYELEDGEEDDEVPEGIEAYINEENGHFIVRIPTDLRSGGEWVTDKRQDEDPVLHLASEQTEADYYTVDYEPVGDGETVAQLYHYTGPACDAMIGYVLVAKDGRVQELEYGFWTDDSDADEWDEYFCGDWAMESDAGNTMRVEKREDGGWDVRIIATLDGETDGFTMSAYYDCDQDLMAYDDGAIHHVVDGSSGEMEEAFANGIPGTFVVMPQQDGGSKVTWTFDAMPGEKFVFVRQ